MIDMHVHTRYSDGEHTPAEVISFGADAGLSTMAITDHDTLDGLEEAVKTAKNKGIRLIPGIEFSVDGNTSHILGYNIDYKAMQKDSEFKNMITRIRQAKRNRAKQMCELSQQDPIFMQNKQGNQYSVSFSLNEVDALFGIRSIYTGHFGAMMAMAVKAHLGVKIDQYEATMLFFKAGKYEKFLDTKIKDLDSNYDVKKVDGENSLLDYIGTDINFRMFNSVPIYVDFNKKDTNIKVHHYIALEKGKKYWNVKEDKSAYPTASRAISLIHQYGGIGVIAHPDEGTTRERVEHYIALGADGIELYSPKNNGGKPYYEQLVRQHNLIATSGTDWHGKTYSPDKRLGITGTGFPCTWIN